MVGGVRSYSDYERHIRELLGALGPQALAGFCAWCLARFAPTFGPAVWDGLAPTERARVSALMEELLGAARAGASIEPARARALLALLEGLGPHDEEEALELAVEAQEFRAALWHALDFSNTRSPASACEVPLRLVHCWDYRLGEDADFSSRMFEHPALRQELEAQEAQVRALRAEA